MGLAELLREMDQGERRNAPKPLPEAICATLREVFGRYVRQNPFKAGDLVTPVADSDMKGSGEPHIVLEVRARPEPDFTASDPRHSGNNAYGRRNDMRVASSVGDSISQHWVESWQFERYGGSGSDSATS